MSEEMVPKAGEMLVRVRSRDDIPNPFNANVIYDQGQDKIVRTGPLLPYLKGIDAETLRKVARANGWVTTIVKVGE